MGANLHNRGDALLAACNRFSFHLAPTHPPLVMLRLADRGRQPLRRADCGGCSRHTRWRCPAPPLSPPSPQAAATRMSREAWEAANPEVAGREAAGREAREAADQEAADREAAWEAAGRGGGSRRGRQRAWRPAASRLAGRGGRRRQAEGRGRPGVLAWEEPSSAFLKSLRVQCVPSAPSTALWSTE